MRKKQKDQEQKADFQIPSRFCFFGAGAGSRKNKYPFFVGTCSRSRVSRGLASFVAAALPKAPICALKLGDRTSTAEVLRWMFEGFRRARSSSAAAPPVRFGVRAFFSPSLERGHRRGAHAFRGGGAPKSPYMRPQARRQDL